MTLPRTLRPAAATAVLLPLLIGAQPCLASDTARGEPQDCIRNFVPEHATDYLRRVAIADELRRRMLCLAAGPADADPQAQRHLQRLREQFQTVVAGANRLERAPPRAPAVLVAGSWPRLQRGLSPEQNIALIRASGAKQVAEAPPQAGGERWSLWQSTPAPDSVLLVFLAQDAGNGGSRFLMLALAPGVDGSVWFDAFRKHLEQQDGNGTFTNARNKCVFGRAAFERMVEYAGDGMLYRYDGEAAIVALDSNGGRAAFDAQRSYLRAKAPEVPATIAHFKLRALVPGPHASSCATLPFVAAASVLGEPGMVRADFRRLWGGANGGRYTLNGQALEVLPEFAGERLAALHISPAIDHRHDGSIYRSPRPRQPAATSHQQVEDLFSKAFGPVAFQTIDSDTAGRQRWRSVWRLANESYLVLTNPVQPDGPFGTQARLTR